MSNDPVTDHKVKRKLVRILASWHAQYKDDPSMRTAANLYKQHKSDAQSVRRSDTQAPKTEELEATKRKNKEEARRKAKEEAEKKAREREAAEKLKKDRAGKPKSKRKPFNFEEVLQRLSNGVSQGVTELHILGKAENPHTDRGCDAICE